MAKMSAEKKKRERARYLWTEIMLLINILLITACFAIGWMHFYQKNLAVTYLQKGIAVIVLLYIVLYVLLGRVFLAFTINTPHKLEIIYGQFLTEFSVDFIMYFVTFLLMKGFPYVWPMLLILLVQLLVSIIWTYIVHTVYIKTVVPLKALVIWDNKDYFDELYESYSMDHRFKIVGSRHISECIDHYDEVLKGIEVVMLIGVHSHPRNKMLKYCIGNDIKMFIVPRVGDIVMSGAKRIHILNFPTAYIERYNPSPMYSIIKRSFDILSSAIMLLITSPIMLIVALLIKRDGGSVLYKQNRLTKNGKVFQLLKFRSMKMDAESDGIARLSSGVHDDRVTPIGKIIRKYRIDELPQLINIIKGDMSVVGPRPERPEIAEQYERSLPEFSFRLQTKAGLTGLAQVYGKYNTNPNAKLIMDLQYIAKASVIEDLSIIFATIKVLFQKDSTDGVKHGQTTALR